MGSLESTIIVSVCSLCSIFVTLCILVAVIYPSRSIVCFWKKIEFSKGVVSSTLGPKWSTSSGSGDKAPEKFWPFYLWIAKNLLKVNESRYKQCLVTPHFSNGQNLLKKYQEKINIDIFMWEKHFNRSVDHNILWLVSFKIDEP